MDIEVVRRQLFIPCKDEYRKAGRSDNGRIDKNGRIYHMVQRGRNRENIYDEKSARYRHDLLCRECSKYGVGILFSVSMPNHTHDLLYAENWDTVSRVVQIVNTQVSRFIRKANPKRFKNDRRVFDERPVYVVVKNMKQIGITGKYIYENAAEFERQGKFVPFSCFFGMRNNYVPTPPYRKDLYEFIYGMELQQMCSFFEENSILDVGRHVEQRFASWTQSDLDTFFKADSSKTWLYDEELP